MHSNERKRKKFQFHYPQLSLGEQFWNWICFRISFIIYPELSIEMQHTRLNAKNKRFVSMERVGWPTIVQLHLYRLPKVTQHTHTHIWHSTHEVCVMRHLICLRLIYIKKARNIKLCTFQIACVRVHAMTDKERKRVWCCSVLAQRSFDFKLNFFVVVFISLIGGGVFARVKKMHISRVYVSTFLFSLHEKWIQRTISWFHDMRAFFSSCNKKMVQENVWKPLQNNINNYNKMKTIRGIKECHRRKIKCFHEAHTFMLWNECSW